MYKKFFKRFIDIIVSGSALTILVLPLGCIALWLHFANKGAGVFFFQVRPGKDGRLFKIVKFKTMNDEKDDKGDLLPDAMRLTRAGKIVRASSVDELPQLWNVLKGDMSLIGPRPLLPRYLPYYTPRENMRHSVRPGISGWAQVNGRNNLGWNEKLEMDAWYAENLSFKLDFRILTKTIKNVITHKDVVPDKATHYLDEERKNLNL